MAIRVIVGIVIDNKFEFENNRSGDRYDRRDYENDYENVEKLIV